MARNDDDDDDDDDDRDDDEDSSRKKKKKGKPTDEEKQMAMFCHLGGLIGGSVIPLVIWMMKKDESRFIDRHGEGGVELQHQLDDLVLCLHAFMRYPSAGAGAACALLANHGRFGSQQRWILRVSDDHPLHQVTAGSVMQASRLHGFCAVQARRLHHDGIINPAPAAAALPNPRTSPIDRRSTCSESAASGTNLLPTFIWLCTTISPPCSR